MFSKVVLSPYISRYIGPSLANESKNNIKSILYKNSILAGFVNHDFKLSYSDVFEDVK